MKRTVKKLLLVLCVGTALLVGAAGGANAIVNGTQSAPNARPYQVSLQSGGGHYCGGSIIDSTTIVTAAHCMEGETVAGTTVRAGVTDATSPAGQDIGLSAITTHPRYDTEELADIAVLKLAEPLTFDSSVQPIPLATAAQVDAATTGVVSGWGAVSEDGEGSDQLLEAEVPMVSDQECAFDLGTDAVTEVCAGGTGTDTCSGDSGGPLAIPTESGLALAGVTSWGDGCGGTTPGVYADVPGLTAWINANRNGDAPPPTGELRCDGKPVTIDMNSNGGIGNGTDGDDVILGTPGDDVINAGAGNDTVCAGSGNDVVIGGEGSDTLLGGAGRDIMRGNAGADVLKGGAGNDRLFGGVDADTISGGEGDDYLGGFGGADTISGGPGDETIFGGFGADIIDAGPGNDKVSGLEGDDAINGGAGNDQLNGDRGRDTINGGPGNDVLNGGNANDMLDGGNGNDTVNGGRADDQLAGGPGTNDTCSGNKHINGDIADATCERIFGVA
jgi:Ca2+-binding RTX toxin-like protein